MKFQEQPYVNHFSDIDSFNAEDKEDLDYLVARVNNIIHRLYYDKKDMRKSFNYFSEIRDNSRYAWLTDNYGFENPQELKFTSLIRPRINALVGVQGQHPVEYKITCVTDHAVKLMEEEQKIEILNKVFNTINDLNAKHAMHLDHLRNPEDLEAGEDGQFNNRVLEDMMKEIRTNYGQNFVSSVERLSQKVLDYLVKTQNLKLKFLKLFKYLLISGEAYYEVYFDELGQDPKIKILNPLNFYHSKDADTDEVKDCPEAFYVERLSRTSIIQRWGDQMTEEESNRILNELWKVSSGYSNYNPELEAALATGGETSESSIESVYNTYSSGVNGQGGRTASTIGESLRSEDNYLDVFHVQWIENNEVESTKTYIDVDGQHKRKKVKRYIQDLYKGIRIGGEDGVFVSLGRVESAIRSVEDPYKTSLLFNGMAYSELNSRPHSMVLSLVDIQDRYDILVYQEENLMAHFHPGGVNIDVPSLPTFLGSDPYERILKSLGLRKWGVNLTDSSQENVNPGGQFGVGEFNSNIDGGALQAIDTMKQGWDNKASEVTGINRQMLGQFEERDGMGVSRQAIAQASLQTKEWFMILDRLIEASLTDMLNLARITYKTGKTGYYLLGEERRLFTINEGFKLSDYRVFLEEGMKQMQGLMEVKQMAQALAQTGAISMEDVLDIIQAKSITEASFSILKRLQREQAARAGIEDMQSELDSANEAIEDLTKQLEEAQSKLAGEELAEIKRKDRELFEKQLHNSETRRIKERELDIKEEAFRRRDEVEKLQAIQGGPTKKVAKGDIGHI